jgi:hypothetical protein
MNSQEIHNPSCNIATGLGPDKLKQNATIRPVLQISDQADRWPLCGIGAGPPRGTGAAPLEFQNSIGFPLAEGLRLVNSLLTGAGLRKEVKLIASGKVYDGFSLVRTLAHGADVVNAARAFMFGLGCIQALQCNR